mgnify:CR=1 FL=1
MLTCDCLGTRIHYRVIHAKTETHNPPLICLHNAGTDHTIWSPVAELLSEVYTLYLLDWPGYGEQREQPKAHGLDDYARLLGAFIKTNQLDTVILIGNCMGSGVALEYYRSTEGKGIQAMLLFNVLVPKTLGVDGQFFYKWSQSSWSRSYRWLQEHIFVPRGMRGFVVRHQLKHPSQVKAAQRKHLEKLNEAPENTRHLGALVKALHSIDTLSDWQKPKHLPPVKVLWGDGNRVLPLQKGKSFVEVFSPDAFEILDAGHLPMLEQPQQCADAIQSFIGSLPTPG